MRTLMGVLIGAFLVSGCAALDHYDRATAKLDNVGAKVSRARSAVSTSRSVGKDVKDLAGGN